MLAEGLAEIPSVDIDPAKVETNIVIFRVPDPAGFLHAVSGEVELSAVDGGRGVRAVTHMDVGRADVEQALAAMKRALTSTAGAPRRPSGSRLVR